MTADLLTLFRPLPVFGSTKHDLEYAPDPDAFVARIGAASNRFGEWRRLAAAKGWLRFERDRVVAAGGW